MLIGIETIILKERPDYVMVYGDTNSTLAGALAAQKLHINVIHVEAGLRSFNMQMPEETNRILTDRISSLLFCPTEQAVSNLKTEGFENFDCQIFLSGDVMLDCALYYAGKTTKLSPLLKNMDLKSQEFLLCTIHRAENTDDQDNLKQIIRALNNLSRKYRIILPLHPRTKKIIESKKFSLSFDPIEPVGYLEMLHLIQHSQLVITDSGGLQKEAYFFGKFCVTLRDQTEWIEFVNADVNVLTGADSSKIIDSVELFSNKVFPPKSSLYGDGNAAERICEIILKEDKRKTPSAFFSLK
jgi:UDP-GlcNAc3NAcA epimerase